MRYSNEKKNKKHVLSFRVEEAEWELLKKTSTLYGVDISTLLRQSLREALAPRSQL